MTVDNTQKHSVVGLDESQHEEERTAQSASTSPVEDAPNPQTQAANTHEEHTEKEGKEGEGEKKEKEKNYEDPVLHDAQRAPTLQIATRQDVTRLCRKGILASYLEYTRNQASPPLFHIWTMIACIGGLLRRNVYIDRGGYYTLYPNMYIVLVAPTAKCMKSTAAAMGVKLLRKVGTARIMHEKITPEGLVSYMAGEMDTPDTFKRRPKSPQSPSLKKALEVVINDLKKDKATPSAETTVTVDNSADPDLSYTIKKEAHCFVFAPELSVFLGNQNYGSGLVELLTSLYEGKDYWEYRTRTKGNIELYNLSINFFGASNPEWLAKGLQEDAFGGGFMGRVIHVFQDKSKKKEAWLRRPPGMEDLEERLVHDLISISKLNGAYEVSDAAIECYTKWYDSYEPDYAGRMSGYYQRKPDHVLKLAMILAASCSDKLVIEKEYMEAALNMLDQVEVLMPQAFAYIGATNEARIAQHVVEVISSSDHQFIAYRRLLASVRHMIKNKREFDDVIDTLRAAGVIKVYQSNTGLYLTVNAAVDLEKELAERKALKDVLTAVKEARVTKAGSTQIQPPSAEQATVAEA